MTMANKRKHTKEKTLKRLIWQELASFGRMAGNEALDVIDKSASLAVTGSIPTRKIKK